MPAYAMGSARSVTTESGFATSPPVANPSDGKCVVMNPFSGPKGSPFDAKAFPTTVWPIVPGSATLDVNNTSTGALSTGIGVGLNCKSSAALTGGIVGATLIPTGIAIIVPPMSESGFTAGMIPGSSLPSQALVTDSRLVAIGGGRSFITPGSGSDWSRGVSSPNPYTAGFALGGFGNGGSRDGGAGPVFTPFGMKLAVAQADVAVGGAVATGFTNRSSSIVKLGNGQFGSNTTASAPPV